ncbi:kinase-like domain-containing protein [Aspergillus fruticulosus]
MIGYTDECDVLNRFRSRTPCIRPLINEIVEPSDPPTIRLNMLQEMILEALKVLLEDNFVHTSKCNYHLGYIHYLIFLEDIKPDNILVNYGQGDVSPEAQLRIGWGTPTDIWSFGALLITLLYGGNFFILKPDILWRQCEFFGLFPLTYHKICPQEKLDVLAYIIQSISPERRKLFSRISEQDISKEDKEFVLKVMKLDLRDRPSTAELLQDKWFAA